MSLRILYFGPLPPRGGGAAVSLGQLLTGFARAGLEIAAIAPITLEELRQQGDWYAARNPALRIYRYVVPYHYMANYRPMPPELEAIESVEMPRLADELVASFAPHLLLAGRETAGGRIWALAARHGLPWCQLLRGSPTGQILSGIYPAERTEPFLRQLRAADRVIAVAGFMADGLRARFGLDGVRTIPNALDLGAFRPRPRTEERLRRFGLPPDAPIVLVPGRLLDRKRPLDILAAARTVAVRQPRVQFVFAGDGPLAQEIARTADAWRLSQHVRLLGAVPYEQMPDLYACADLVVMASESEGMSRVYMEAMASGVPLVASDILASRELVSDGETGVLFPLGDTDALAARVLELLADARRRAALAAAARRAVRDRDIDRAVAAYIAEFEGVVGRTHRTPATASGA